MQFFSITLFGFGSILKSQIKPINDTCQWFFIDLEIQEGELEKSMSETLFTQLHKEPVLVDLKIYCIN